MLYNGHTGVTGDDDVEEGVEEGQNYDHPPLKWEMGYKMELIIMVIRIRIKSTSMAVYICLWTLNANVYI